MKLPIFILGKHIFDARDRMDLIRAIGMNVWYQRIEQTGLK